MPAQQKILPAPPVSASPASGGKVETSKIPMKILDAARAQVGAGGSIPRNMTSSSVAPAPGRGGPSRVLPVPSGASGSNGRPDNPAPKTLGMIDKIRGAHSMLRGMSMKKLR